jgi:phosphatidylserine/phosphatidylglycerophosphate/cardiolipin synthase-like enzyme
VKPIAAPGKPPAPAAPAAPPQPFATCQSDDAAMLKVRSRDMEDPAYKGRGMRRALDWYPASPAPTPDNQVVTYVQGTCAFADMADAIATAFQPEHRIYLAGWSTNKDVALKAGTATSLESYLTSTRAQVRGMFYDGKITLTPLIKIGTGVENKWVADAINATSHGAAVIDSKLPPISIHHQKLLVVQGQFGLIAFIGGMDFDPSRTEVNPAIGRPWHDTHIRLAGAAALACRQVFEDRWLDHPATAALDQRLGASATATEAERRALAFPPPAPLAIGDLPSGTMPPDSRRFTRRVHVAVGRTFGNLTKSGRTPYKFAPSGDYGAWALIEKGIKQATRWIYLEDQYLVSRMARQALLAKLADSTFEYLLMVMNGSAAAASDFKFLITARNEFRRDLLRVDPKKARWGMYTLKQPTDPERQKWCGNYVHSKTWVFDDGYVILGSANCDNRGYTTDTEVVAGIADANLIDVRIGASFATDLRTVLWHKHLGVAHANLRDWDKGIKFWRSPPPSAMVEDASGLELDYDLTPPSHFPSAAEAKNVELAWVNAIDPDWR